MATGPSVSPGDLEVARRKTQQWEWPFGNWWAKRKQAGEKLENEAELQRDAEFCSLCLQEDPEIETEMSETRDIVVPNDFQLPLPLP